MAVVFLGRRAVANTSAASTKLHDGSRYRDVNSPIVKRKDSQSSKRNSLLNLDFLGSSGTGGQQSKLTILRAC